MNQDELREEVTAILFMHLLARGQPETQYPVLRVAQHRPTARAARLDLR